MTDSEKINVSDSVVQGGITNISNDFVNSNRVTCKNCKTSGNLTIFVCREENCENEFCEHCRDDNGQKQCHKCVKKIADEKYRKLNKFAIERDKQKELAESAYEKEDKDDFLKNAKKCIESGKKHIEMRNEGERTLSDIYEELGVMMRKLKLWKESEEWLKEAIDFAKDESSVSWIQQDLMLVYRASENWDKYYESVNWRAEFGKNEETGGESTTINALLYGAIFLEEAWGNDDERVIELFERTMKEIKSAPYTPYGFDYLRLMGWPEELTKRGYHQFTKKPNAKDKKAKPKITKSEPKTQENRKYGIPWENEINDKSRKKSYFTTPEGIITTSIIILFLWALLSQ